jgi:hypothetical protein
MPTTATVAPHRVRTAEDVVAGLRAFADLIEAGAFPGITGALRADLHVTNRDSVEAAARVVDTDATDAGGGLLKAAASIAGVELTVYTVDRARVLRRDPEATAALAERDA